MRTIETTVYTFDELAPKAKERARQWWREGFEYNDEFVIDDFKAIAALLGFKVDKVYWSGFCSQGDGACFTGEFVRDFKPDAVKGYAPQDESLRVIAGRIQHTLGQFPAGEGVENLNDCLRIKRMGRFQHAYTMYVDSNPDNDTGFEVEMLRHAHDLANWLYRGLQADYYAQLSDEFVDENILANEYEFDAKGDRFVAG